MTKKKVEVVYSDFSTAALAGYFGAEQAGSSPSSGFSWSSTQREIS
jgi:hypothetical protein